MCDTMVKYDYGSNKFNKMIFAKIVCGLCWLFLILCLAETQSYRATLKNCIGGKGAPMKTHRKKKQCVSG